MATSEKFETLVHRQKRAQKAWMDEVVKRGEKPSPTADGLVWELLLSYGEAARRFEDTREHIYKTAYELAGVVLDRLDEGHLTKLYRDCLVDAIIDTSDESSPCDCRTIVQFANTISTAFSEAHADPLKETIRQNTVENISNELRAAKAIQKHLLPRTIPQIPGYQFAGRLVPAQEVGGDYWSIKYWKDDGVVTLKLADVSGHGIAAATLVAAVKFISGGYYKGAANPSEVIRQTNRVLAKETPSDIIVTMVYGWLRPDTRQLTIVNAGHSPAFLCREDTCIDFYPTGPVLGVAESDYTETDIQLVKNDIVFFGSDGITEAGITDQFGIERLKELVIRNSRLSADVLADNVIQAVSDCAGQPHDDVSLVVVKVTR